MRALGVGGFAAFAVSLAAYGAFAQPSIHGITKVSLAELGYRLSVSRPEAAITLEGPNGETWSLPPRSTRFDLRFNGPSDHTGDGVPELIVIEHTSRRGGTVHVIELASEGPHLVLQRGVSNAEIDAFAKLAPGETLDVVGTDTMRVDLQPRPTAAQRMSDLGYSINHEDADTFQILRNDQPVHAVRSFAINVHGPAYMTDSEEVGFLILSANSRSFSDLVLIELTEDGPKVRLSEHGFTRDVTEMFKEALDRIEAGQPVVGSNSSSLLHAPERLDLKLRE